MPDSIVIFDLDGTLFRTETVTVPALTEAFHRVGLTPPPAAEICAWFGRPTTEYPPWLRSLCPGDLADAVERFAVRRELELVGEVGELYPRIPETLDQVRAVAHFMAICSNGPRQYVQTILDRSGIAGFFDAVRHRGPDDCDKSQMLHDLLDTLRSPPEAPGVVIGDRFDDIEAAHANGLAAIGAGYGYGQAGELDQADAIATTPGELVALATSLLTSRARRR